MNDCLSLTVQDILQYNIFKDALVIAGSGGLNRIVDWVHPMEITNVGHLVNGNDLILSTGVGWKNETDLVNLLEQLIKRNASGICIELGKYIKSIPKSIIDVANNSNFPIIIFTKEVRFIDISHNINSYIINHKYQSLSKLDEFTLNLNRLLIKPHKINDILTFIQRFLDVYVIFIPVHEEIIFSPSLSTRKQKRFLDYFQSFQDNSFDTKIMADGRAAYKTVSFLNQKLAKLGIATKEKRKLKEYEIQILDRTALVLAQEMIRVSYMEEKRKDEDYQWVHDWLNGKLGTREIQYYLRQFEYSLQQSLRFTVFLVEFCALDKNKSLRETMLNINFFARPFFEQNDFYMISCIYSQEIIYVLIDKGKLQSYYIRAKKVITKLELIASEIDKNLRNNIIIGVGKDVNMINNLKKSYQTAQEAIFIQKKLNKKEPFYDNLNIYRVIALADKNGTLTEFILDYLKPIIEYDQKHNSNLLVTLEVFLKTSCSKQETCNQLYIARQTLYNRIERIQELLGPDFLSPEKRITIEFAIYAYNFNKYKKTVSVFVK